MDMFYGLTVLRLDVDWMIIRKHVGLTINPVDTFILSNILCNISMIRPSLRSNMGIGRVEREIFLVCCVLISARTLSPSSLARLNTEQVYVFFLFFVVLLYDFMLRHQAVGPIKDMFKGINYCSSTQAQDEETFLKFQCEIILGMIQRDSYHSSERCFSFNVHKEFLETFRSMRK